MRSLRRYSSQGASLYVYQIETAAKETDKPMEWKRRYTTRKYSQKRQGKFRILSDLRDRSEDVRIGSSASPSGRWEIMKAE